MIAMHFEKTGFNFNLFPLGHEKIEVLPRGKGLTKK